MALNPQLRDILTLIGDLTQNNVNARKTITNRIPPLHKNICYGVLIKPPKNDYSPVVVRITDLSGSNRLTLLF
jgi:hypothetical protein